MKKSRIKKTLPTITTRDEAESVVGEIALVTANRDRHARNMDLDLASIRDRYMPNLLVYEADLKEKTDALCTWAQAHPEEFPKGRKSIAFIQGTLGFRTGNPKLALFSRKWNWDKVLAALMTLGGQLFIRTKDEVDKDRLLKDHASKSIDDTWLCSVGCKVTQDESFFVEPTLTEVAIRQDRQVAPEISNLRS